MAPPVRRIVSVAIAVIAVGSLVVSLLWFLQEPGYSRSRLVLFAAMAGAGALALFGIVADRPVATGTGILGLFLLGFWQAILSIVVFPVIAALLIALTVDRDSRADASPR